MVVRCSLLLLVLALCTAPLQHATALYHTSSETLHWFSHWAAKRPDLLRFRELHERHTNTVLPVATLSNGINSPQYKHRPVVLFVFGEHAREVITSEVGIWLARLLVDPNSSAYDWPELPAAFERAGINSSWRSTAPSAPSAAAAAAAGGSTAGPGSPGSSQQQWKAAIRSWVQELLQQLEVVIVPIEALDSRRLVEEGQLCVRKTASNVDLNRNWPFAWKQESASEEQYGGPSPFSEPQSRLMRHLIDHLTGRLLGYVNVHSGEWALYTPWDSKQAYGPGLPADLPDLVGAVGRLCECRVGPAGAVSGYLAYGTSMDYLYVHKRVPYPLTVEVYGGDNVGKLAASESNKDLAHWPVVTKANAPTTADAQFQRRRLLQQQQQPRQRQIEQQPFQHPHQQQLKQQQQQQQQVDPQLLDSAWQRSRAASSRRLLGWVRGLLQVQQGNTGLELQQQPQQQQQQQKKRRRNRLRQQGSGWQHVHAADAASTGTVPGGSRPLFLPHPADSSAAAAAEAGGFSAAGRLDQLREQARLQLQQQQQGLGGSGGGTPSLSVLSTADPQQQPGSGGNDPILALLAAAHPSQRSCFTAFNPPTEAEYRRVVADWLAASLMMARHMLAGQEGQQMVALVAAGKHDRFRERSRSSGITVKSVSGSSGSSSSRGSSSDPGTLGGH